MDQVKSPLILFLGAGFSRWAADLPLVRELFDYNISDLWKKDQEKLEVVKSLKTDWDMLDPDGYEEKFIAHALNLPKDQRDTVIWYICRRLSEPFIRNYFSGKPRRQVLMIDEKRRLSVRGIFKTKQFIERFLNHSGQETTSIITTNYDLLIEYALGTKGFNYGRENQNLQGRGPHPLYTWKYGTVKTEGKIRLAKIHGSISWDENSFYTDGRGGITGKALIIPPTPEKTPPENLRQVWNLATSILEEATTCVFFGFAFNEYDKAVLELLKSGGRNIQHILLVDIEPKIEAATAIFSNATIESCLPPSEKDTTLYKWLETKKSNR
ncbi:MAG: hypothetical protein DPW16_11525 [Chloroflexi bacterium]|nr:hypothetical protein [Chloroflexota bacterium]